MEAFVTIAGLVAGLVFGGVAIVAAAAIWWRRQVFGAGGAGLAAAGTAILGLTLGAFGTWPAFQDAGRPGVAPAAQAPDQTSVSNEALNQAQAQIAELTAALEDAKQANQSMLATLNEINAERATAARGAAANAPGPITITPIRPSSAPPPTTPRNLPPTEPPIAGGPPPGMPDPRGAFIPLPQAGVPPGMQPGAPMPNLPPSVVTPPPSASAAVPAGPPDPRGAFIAVPQSGQAPPPVDAPPAPAGPPSALDAFIAPGQQNN